MQRTKVHFEEGKEELYFNERAYLQAENELKEKELSQQIFEEEMSQGAAKIILGEPRKAGKFGRHAKVSLRKFFRKPIRYKH